LEVDSETRRALLLWAAYVVAWLVLFALAQLAGEILERVWALRVDILPLFAVMYGAFAFVLARRVGHSSWPRTIAVTLFGAACALAVGLAERRLGW
jgi:hypothetical protein